MTGNPLRRAVLGVLVFILGLPTGAAGAKPKLSPEDAKRLVAGETIVTARELAKEGVVAARALALVEATPETVWRHIETCARYQEFMPQVAESRELARAGGVVTCYVRVDMPFPLDDLWSETDAKHEARDGHRFRRRWKATKGSYRVNEGAWVLSPFEGDASRTLVVYTIKVAPRMEVPKALLKQAQRRSLPKMMDALRTRARESKGS